MKFSPHWGFYNYSCQNILVHVFNVYIWRYLLEKCTIVKLLRAEYTYPLLIIEKVPPVIVPTASEEREHLGAPHTCQYLVLSVFPPLSMWLYVTMLSIGTSLMNNEA